MYLGCCCLSWFLELACLQSIMWPFDSLTTSVPIILSPFAFTQLHFPLQMASQCHCYQLDGLHVDEVTDGSPLHDPLSALHGDLTKRLKPMQNSSRDDTLRRYGAANDRHLCDLAAFSGFSTSPSSF